MYPSAQPGRPESLLQVSVNQDMHVDFPELEELGPEGPLDSA